MEERDIKSIVEFSRILNLIFVDSFRQKFLAKLTSKSISNNQFTILNILKVSGPLLVSEIADMMQLSHAAASKNIDILVKYNLVSRNILSNDRRKASVALLKAGERIVQKYEDLLAQKQQTANTFLSNKERTQLNKLLSKYVNKCLLHEKELDFICIYCSGRNGKECILLQHNINCRFKFG